MTAVAAPAWGDVSIHPLAVELIPDPRRRRRRCSGCAKAGVKSYATHVGTANGLAMISGRKWHMHRWARRRGRP